ncbi:MAG: winged helix-turn-helix domain-containing protein [Candidatus Methanomethylophilaceae archaeon]|jgi:DNA-binding transcriptional ArsR family regulator
MTENNTNDFVLYYTEKGLIHVSNEVRIQILDELTERSLSLTDLVKITGKAQSTLSVHLDKMMKDGIIDVKEDPEDSRRKTYSIVSLCLVRTTKPDPESFEKAKELFNEISDDPKSVGAHMTSLIVLSLDYLGLSVMPLAETLGKIHAQVLHESMTKGPVDDVIDNLIDMYSYANLGEVTVFKRNPLTLVVKSDMRVSKGAAKSFGMYARGFFIQALNIIYGVEAEVPRWEVFGADNNYYKFELDVRQ